MGTGLWKLASAAAVGVVVAGLGLVGVPAAAQPPPGQDAPEGESADEEDDAEGPRHGPPVYQEQCVFCHGADGTGTNRGPPLVGVGAASADFYLRSGRMPLPNPGAEAHRGVAQDGGELPVNDAQIRELVDYVESLGGGPPIPDVDLGEVDRARGGDLYRRHCAPCHNWDGKGGALMNRQNAPELHGVPPTQIAEAVRVGPGAMPEFGPETIGDEELDDLVVYAAEREAPVDRGGYHWGHWGPATETVAGFLGVGVLLLVTAWLGERK